MTERYKIIGPPGTGKTGAITRTIEAWMSRDGYRPEDIVLTSFTKSAAAVLAGRTEIPHDNIATLHALAYRSIGSPPLAEKGELAKQWNEGHANLPSWQVGGGISNEDDGLTMPDAEIGEQMRLYALARCKMLPPAHPLFDMTKDFVAAWEEWKRQTGSVDFMDMIDLALLSYPIEGVGALFIDEAQDLVPLQWLLVKHWSTNVERLVIAGDPAQTLYHFAGATPDDILTPLDGEHLWPQTQSYRLPSEILSYAERWLARHSGSMMADRHYAPRERVVGGVEHPDTAGRVSSIAATWKRPEAIVDAIEADDRDCMILAPCAYMLQPVIGELRSRGILFGNKYRRSNGMWNPMPRATGDGKRSTARMVAAFVDGAEAKDWIELIRADSFMFKSARSLVEEGSEQCVDMLKPEHRAAFEARDLHWLHSRMLVKYAKPAEYAIQIIQRNGTEVLKHEPRITVGSFHSVKGGEAKVTYLFPDLSIAGAVEQQSTQAGADSAIRLGYVGLTRASEELVLAGAVDQRRALW